MKPYSVVSYRAVCNVGSKYKLQLPLSFNPLNTKRGLLYLNTQFVPRSKHFSSRL